LSNVPNGMIGTRASAGSQGGTVDLLQLDTSSCVGDGGIADICTFNLIPVSIPPGSAPIVSAPKPVGAVPKLGSAGGGSYLGGGPDSLIAFPPINGQSAFIQHFSPTGDSLGQKVDFPTSGFFLKPVAVSECFNMAFVVELRTDTEVFGIPIAGG